MMAADKFATVANLDNLKIDATALSAPSVRADRIRAYVNATRATIIETGIELLAAKAQCEHGTWLDWLSIEFGWTDRTARNYMQVASAFKSETVSDFTIDSGALSAPSVPAAARDEAVVRVDDLHRQRGFFSAKVPNAT